MHPHSLERYTLTLDSRLLQETCRPALIWATEIDTPEQSESLPGFLSALVDRAALAGESFVPAERRQRVRKMLRYGKYRPSGRGKPSSEYLLRAALAGSFPTVNAPVDANNAISLESGFPASIFDASLSGTQLLLRHGLAEESYVFNTSGQSIDLEDLLVVCRRGDVGWAPCGNPVKDSMLTKISPQTTDVIAVLYVPVDEPMSSAEQWACSFAELLQRACGAGSTGYRVIEEPASRPGSGSGSGETLGNVRSG